MHFYWVWLSISNPLDHDCNGSLVMNTSEIMTVEHKLDIYQENLR